MKESLLKPKITPTTTNVFIATSDTIERKIENATEGLSPECFNFLHKRIFETDEMIDRRRREDIKNTWNLKTNTEFEGFMASSLDIFGNWYTSPSPEERRLPD